MVTKTSLKKWIRATSNLIAFIPTRSIRQMLAHFSGVEFLKAVSNFRKRKRKSLSCVHVLDKAWNKAFSRCTRAATAKKWTEKSDARAKLLFCQSKPIVFLPFSVTSPSSSLKLRDHAFRPYGPYGEWLGRNWEILWRFNYNFPSVGFRLKKKRKKQQQKLIDNLFSLRFFTWPIPASRNVSL